MSTGTCNCCDNGSDRSAWCKDCTVRYVGSTETGLDFVCITHRRDIEIIISFELGEVADGN